MTRGESDHFSDIRNCDHSAGRSYLVRDRVAVIAIEAHYISRALERMSDRCGINFRTDRVQPELECSHDSEVSAATADCPEQVFILSRASPQDSAVGGYDLRSDDIVASQAVPTAEPADPSAEREPADARVRHGT